MRILLTNDDGYHAPGLAALERIAATLSDDVWIVAPAEDQSGTSRSLTLTRPMRLRQFGERRFSVTGTPTDSVLMALAGGSDSAAMVDRAQSGTRGDSTIFRPDRPLAELTQAAAGEPTDPTYALGVIRGLASQGNWGAAAARAQALVRAAPGAPAAQLAYGDILALSGRSAKAVAPYARAANLTFDEPTMLRLIDGQIRAAKPRDAAVALGLYISQNPQSVAARRLLGEWQLRNGDWDAAIELLEGLRDQLSSRDVVLLRDLALAYAGAGDGVVARRYGAAAYRLAPMNPEVADAYGVALAAAGEAEGARQLFDKALSLSPGNPVVIAHRDAL